MSRAELIEAVAIILSILALVPLAFGYHRPWYSVLLVLVLIVMAVVTVRRIGRISALFRDRK